MAGDPLWAIEQMTNDGDLQGRIRAAAAQESAYGSVPDIPDPSGWAWTHRYDMCVAPQWGADYAYAVETGVERPGLEPAVISDDRIRSQVVAVAAPEGEPQLVAPEPPIAERLRARSEATT